MSISEFLLTEFDEEMKKTRAALARVPVDKGEFRPHAKSTALKSLAPHIAQLGGFGHIILTTPGLDFSQGSIQRIELESAEQLVKVFDEGAAKARAALAGLSDEVWHEKWRLSLQGKKLFEGTRFLAYRQMFVNHLVHHRAQLGVYLRLNDVPVPSTYGPSADEPVV